MTKYICFEGSEGVGKTTQVSKIVAHLKQLGFKVLETKEPGTIHSPLTMELRKLMLDSKFNVDGATIQLAEDLSNLMNNTKYQSEFTDTAKDYLNIILREIASNPKMTQSLREVISQAIRHIHLVKVVQPAHSNYDYVIQDRGILSGLAYGVASGSDYLWMEKMNNKAVVDSCIALNSKECYTQIIILEGNVSKGLGRALTAKKEFESGDVMENKGVSFLDQVNENFKEFKLDFKNVLTINVDDLGIEEVFQDIKNRIL